MIPIAQRILLSKCAERGRQAQITASAVALRVGQENAVLINPEVYLFTAFKDRTT